MTRGGTREQRANGVNGLAAAANDAADVSSSKLQLKDGCPAAWNFREDHIVGKFNQLSNDELEKLSHAGERLITNSSSHNSYSMTDGVESSSSVAHRCKVRCPERIIWQTSTLRTRTLQHDQINLLARRFSRRRGSWYLFLD